MACVKIPLLILSRLISHFWIKSNMWQENRCEKGWTDIFKGCVSLACFWDIIIYSSGWCGLFANQKGLKNTLSICKNSGFPNFLFHISFFYLFAPLSLWILAYIVNKWMSCNLRDMRQQAIMIIYTWKYFPCPFLLPLFNFAEYL